MSQIPPFQPGKFAMAAAGLLKTHDRPEITHRGVHVLRASADGFFGRQIDKYPDATGWDIDDRGQLDVVNDNSKHYQVAAYPHDHWNRVWFPDAETAQKFELPTPADQNDHEPLGETDDVKPNEG